jgi:hypothetical protein
MQEVANLPRLALREGSPKHNRSVMFFVKELNKPLWLRIRIVLAASNLDRLIQFLWPTRNKDRIKSLICRGANAV